MTDQQLPAKTATVRMMIEKLKPQLQAAATAQLDINRFARIAMTAIQRSPRLAECDPRSLAGALISCAQLGLEPDDVRALAYLVPYYNSQRSRYEVQLIPGYKGLSMLACRSGEIRNIYPVVVHDRDRFVWRGNEELPDHQPYWDDDPGPVKVVLGVASFKDGSHFIWPVPRPELEATKKRALGNKKNADENPWVKFEEAMQMKTAIRRVCKFLPHYDSLAAAVALDERADADLPQGLDELAPDSIPEAVTIAAEPLPAPRRKQKDAAPEPSKEPQAIREPKPEPSHAPQTGSLSISEETLEAVLTKMLEADRAVGIKGTSKRILAEDIGLVSVRELTEDTAKSFLARLGVAIESVEQSKQVP